MAWMVELTGATGAGKSTALEELVGRRTACGGEIVEAQAFLLRRRIGWSPRSRMVRGLAVDLVVLPAFLRFALRNGALCLLAARLTAGLPARFAWRAARNVVQKLGAWEALRGEAGEWVIVLDEGPLQQAHSLFAHPDRTPDMRLLERFVRLAPKPGLVVHFRGPAEALAGRMLARGHQRFQGTDREAAVRFIAHAAGVFEGAARVAAEACRVLSLEGGPGAADAIARAIDEAAMQGGAETAPGKTGWTT